MDVLNVSPDDMISSSQGAAYHELQTLCGV